MTRTGVFIFVLCLFTGISFGQNKEIDSLYRLLADTKVDTTKIKLLNLISWELAHAGKHIRAIETATEAKDLSEKIDYQSGLSSSYSKLGNVYYSQSNYSRALDYHLKSLKIAEAIGDKNQMGVAYNNLGNVYSEQGDNKKVLEYYEKDLKICQELNDKAGVAITYSNIGIVYDELGDFQKSLEYQLKALKIRQELGDMEGIGMTYLNMGSVYEDLKDYEQAMNYSLKALPLLKEFGTRSDIGIVYINLGSVHNKLKQYKLAMQYSQVGLEISKEIGEIDNMRLCYENLAEAYSKTGDHKQAYEYHVQFKKLTDSIFNVANLNQISGVNINYEVEKKEAELNAKSMAEKERLKTIAAEETKRHRIIMFAVIAILCIVVFFSFSLLKRFRVTNKQKEIIEIQKHLVDEKQKEIIDSINYAKRIQQAILPAISLIKRALPDSFVLYKPKDIVAGDFFWFESLHSPRVTFIAAADCTGHGVPGALVSVVCSNALNRAVNEFKITDPGKILDKTKELVIATFEKSGEGVMDGMDISLASLQTTESGLILLAWSGANNSLWYVKNKKLEVIKGDKQPIGKSYSHQPFTTQTVLLDKGDVFYLFTDGYVDQFGGEKGKKFKHRQMHELVNEINSLPMSMQNELLSARFEEWKGNLEQADDVTVIGVRV